MKIDEAAIQKFVTFFTNVPNIPCLSIPLSPLKGIRKIVDMIIDLPLMCSKIFY